MAITHSLDDLKRLHHEAMQFFSAQLMFLKEVVPQILDDRLAKAATLLLSCGQTGAAIFQLSHQVETFTSETVMLARSFMEGIINFCYVGICDEKEFRAFTLHPIYKYYHLTGAFKFDDNTQDDAARKKKQEELKKKALVQEALAIFSDTKPYLNWTKKTLDERITAIEKWGKLMDVVMTISKMQYYADASEVLHGSLNGSIYNLGILEPEFDYTNAEAINKRCYKNNACVLLHLGMLIHESFTLISYTTDIKETWDYSYKNRNRALNLLFHVWEKQPKAI